MKKFINTVRNLFVRKSSEMYRNTSASVLNVFTETIDQLETINASVKEEMDNEQRKIDEATEERNALLEVHNSNTTMIDKFKYLLG